EHADAQVELRAPAASMPVEAPCGGGRWSPLLRSTTVPDLVVLCAQDVDESILGNDDDSALEASCESVDTMEAPVPSRADTSMGITSVGATDSPRGMVPRVAMQPIQLVYVLSSHDDF
ncbi:MAG: hypothetical protein SGPRY_002277, partial [Prymnesium sp.]